MFTAKSAAILALILCAAPGAALGQDAMSTPGNAMEPSPMAGNAMASPMSEEDLGKCLEQSAMVTFTPAMQAATDACHAMHGGAMDAMGGSAMGGAMAPAAPAQ